MGYFRYTQPIFQCNIDLDSNLVIDNTHLYTLVEMFLREEHRLPVTKARRSDANDAIAFTDGLDSNSMNSVGQDFYFTKRARPVLWLDNGSLWHVHVFFSSSIALAKTSNIVIYSHGVFSCSLSITSKMASHLR